MNFDYTDNASNTPPTKLLDFHSLAFIKNPYPFLKLARRRDPVHFIEGIGWVLTRYEDCVQALREPRLRQGCDEYLMNKGNHNIEKQPCYKMTKEILTMLDPPAHASLKRLLVPFFSKSRMAKLCGVMKDICKENIEILIKAGSPADVIKGYAHALPLKVISGFLGIPERDQQTVYQLAKDWGVTVHYTPLKREVVDAGNYAALWLEQYLIKHLESDLKTKVDGLYFLDELVEANSQLEDPLSEFQLLCNIVTFYYAGLDSQRLMFSNALAALHAHPDQLTLAREDPSIVWKGVEELFRYDPIFQFTGRFAVEDLVVGGKLIRKGQLVLVSIAAANRDPERYQDPDRLNMLRPDMTQSMTLGHGMHKCLGVHLAYQSVPTMLEVLFERIPDHRLAKGAVRNPSHVQRGFNLLPIEW